MPSFENMALANGVVLTYEGVRKFGARPQTVDFGVMTTGDGKVRMGKRQYEELVQRQAQNQSRFKGAGVENSERPLYMHSAGGRSS